MAMRDADEGPISHGWAAQTRILEWVVLLLFLGHVLPFATGALLFMYLGEFSDIATAFYHSAPPPAGCSSAGSGRAAWPASFSPSLCCKRVYRPWN